MEGEITTDSMSEQEHAARLALNRLTLGSDVQCRLIEHFGSASSVFNASADQLRSFSFHGSRLLDDIQAGIDASGVQQDLDWIESSSQHRVVYFDDPRYPRLLKEIHRPPPVLFLKGRDELLHVPILAIVGSRNPTPAGKGNARAFAQYLSSAGMTICSGLALGIDGAAHDGALSGMGSTIAVTATGLDRIYPASHRELAHRIADQGLLVSEFPIGVGPRRQHFPRRNRIISGLSLGTLVVEATLHSGSLITARYSMEQGREVYAIPGSIHSPLARGCHALIREGAKLVETAMDIVDELPPMMSVATTDEQVPGNAEDDCDGNNGLNDQEAALMEALGHDPATIDVLVERTGWSVEQVSCVIMDLQLRSCINALPGGVYMRTYSG